MGKTAPSFGATDQLQDLRDQFKNDLVGNKSANESAAELQQSYVEPIRQAVTFRCDE